ncbi:BMFP domain-containing protein YqiC [Sinorhizobium medicae]
MSTGANRILDDLARLMTDAAGAAQGVRREVEAAFRAQTENWLNSLDVVKREEFEAVKEMAGTGSGRERFSAGSHRSTRSAFGSGQRSRSGRHHDRQVKPY